MYDYRHFALWVPIALAKNYFFRVVQPYLEGIVLKHVVDRLVE